MSFIYPKYVNIIKHENSLLGFNHQYMNYIIGFQKRKHARLVYKNVNQSSFKDIKLVRSEPTNVGKEVSYNLANKEEMDITIDMTATLIIPKVALEDFKLEIIELEFEEFLMYPFTHHIGVTYLDKIIENNQEQFIFSSQVVDPCDDLDVFRRTLSINET